MKKDIQLSAEGKNFSAYVSLPDGEIRGGVIVLEEIWGVDLHIKSIADRFAAEGYAAIAPELLGDTGILEKISPSIFAEMRDPTKALAAQAKMREVLQPISEKSFAEITEKRLAVTFAHLKEKIPNKKIGIVGFCFGGTWSFFLASKEPGLACAVPFYGQSPNPLDEVAKINCPVMAFYGEKDERLVASVGALVDAMKKYNKDFTYKIYPHTGHAFMNDTRPDAYNAEAAKDAWNMTLGLLRKTVG